jgi:hypothetical protein
MKSVIDQESNNITLMDCLEQINLKAAPISAASARIALPINYELVSFFTRADDNLPCRGEGRVTIVGPSGAAIEEPVQFVVDLTTHDRLRMRNRIAGLPIKGSGRYKFVLQYRNEGESTWLDAAKVPLQVVLEVAEEVAQR